MKRFPGAKSRVSPSRRRRRRRVLSTSRRSGNYVKWERDSSEPAVPRRPFFLPSLRVSVLISTRCLYADEPAPPSPPSPPFPPRSPSSVRFSPESRSLFKSRCNPSAVTFRPRLSVFSTTAKRPTASSRRSEVETIGKDRKPRGISPCFPPSLDSVKREKARMPCSDARHRHFSNCLLFSRPPTSLLHSLRGRLYPHPASRPGVFPVFIKPRGSPFAPSFPISPSPDGLLFKFNYHLGETPRTTRPR